MHQIILTLRPHTPFGSMPKGDTFFGQLCWAIRHRYGEQRLQALLEDYTTGRPFAVVSDGLPAGHLPLPELPLHQYDPLPDADRKVAKKRRWLRRKDFERPLHTWLQHARTPAELAMTTTRPQPHNTISRATGTTGTGVFAPYQLEQIWFEPDARLDLYITYDAQRLSANELTELVEQIGSFGYGRDATTGLGKFSIEKTDTTPWPAHDHANALLTLAPCAPQGLALNERHCFYQTFVRFGRHGDQGVHTGKPFKAPLLLADTGALLSPSAIPDASFIGQGLGGDGSLSRAIPETVHQGYAPVISVRLEDNAS